MDTRRSAAPGRLAAPFNIGVKRGFMFVNQNLVNITLDGQAVEVTSGMTVLEAINLAGLSHPQICYVPEVDPIQTCDTCIVEIDGKLARACSTIAVSGMNVKLSSASAKAAQTEAMDRILENHLLYCTVCDNNNGNCKLHNTAEMMEIEHQKYPYRPKVEPSEVDMSHPFYPDIPRVKWDNGGDINDSSCVSCGQCVTICPCNALMEKSMLGEAGFMTGINEEVLNPMIDLVKEVWTKGRKILKVQPSHDAPVNAISTCVKGKFGWDFVNSEERITTPLIRQGDAFVEATWDEALSLVAERLGGIRKEYGNHSVGFISSSKITNEENYVIQKLARQVFETNDVDNCSRYCQSPASDGLMST
ncbi:hypothetical protein BGX30_001054, partial [Mortierella sp. GBA39]